MKKHSFFLPALMRKKKGLIKYTISLVLLFSVTFILGQEALTNHIVQVMPKEKGVKIYLNGIYKGQTNEAGIFYLRKIEEGKYRLEAKKEGYKTDYKSMKLGLLTERINLYLSKRSEGLDSDKEKILKPKFSSLIVYCNEKDSDVYLDGKFMGKINIMGYRKLERTTPGKHKIVVKKNRFTSKGKSISIDPGETGTLDIKLIPGSNSKSLVFLIIFLIILIGIISYALIVSNVRRTRVKFDRYIVQSVIGRGGMATIFKAKDISNGQVVALKIMDIAFQNDKDLIKKFEREGWALSKIKSNFPNAPIVKIFRYGHEHNRSKGRPFIAMELLSGKDLLSIIRTKRKINLSFAYKIVDQIGEALVAAHSNGIYHRDVTPDNIIVIHDSSINPIVKLIDFGVARHEYTAIGTLDGSISGKPPYMSPEQCRGEKVDGRSDIYSLGILFYTLLNGRPPYESKNPFEVMKHHEVTPLPSLKRNIPETIKKVLFKMLNKNKNKRYKTMFDFLINFRKALTTD